MVDPTRFRGFARRERRSRPCPSRWRRTAPTLLTGRLPPQHGFRGNSFYRLAERETTLAELLKRAGYRTGAVVGAAVLDRRFGLDQGFDVYDDQTPPRTGGDFIAERDATAVVSRAIEWLTSRPDSAPFFLWVHLFDPHDPGPSARALRVTICFLSV